MVTVGVRGEVLRTAKHQGSIHRSRNPDHRAEDLVLVAGVIFQTLWVGACLTLPL